MLERGQIFRAPTQDGGVGSGSKDQYIFHSAATKGKAPDVDGVNLALNELDDLYRELGVPAIDRAEVIQRIGNPFYAGDRKRQLEAADNILRQRDLLLAAVDRLSELRMIGQIFPPAEVEPPIL